MLETLLANMGRRRAFVFGSLAWGALSLTACTIGPDYRRPEVELPSAWQSGAEAVAQPVTADWWKTFGDAPLDALISEALEHNQDLVAAAARMDEARAQAGIARSMLLPQLSAGASAMRSRTSSNPDEVPAKLGDLGTAGGMLSWEIDLWGKLRRLNEAARAGYAASRLDRDATRLSITAQVADTYFQLVAIDTKLAITQDTLRSRNDALRINQRRFERGLISELDFRQAQAEAASAKAEIPVLTQSMRETEHALGVLVGRTPRELVEGRVARAGVLTSLTAPPAIPEGLPSTLLIRRPDIQAAEQRLVAANARIGVARAAYLPTINLTSTLGIQSDALNNLFAGPVRTWSFAANLAAPIFDWGRTGAGVDVATAQQRQALAQYQSSIQIAFRETLDAMSNRATSSEREAALRMQLDALQSTLKVAQLRYGGGYAAYLDVLDAQRGVYAAELQVVDARLVQLTASVALFKALGGGWQAAGQAGAPEARADTPAIVR